MRILSLDKHERQGGHEGEGRKRTPPPAPGGRSERQKSILSSSLDYKASKRTSKQVMGGSKKKKLIENFTT